MATIHDRMPVVLTPANDAKLPAPRTTEFALVVDKKAPPPFGSGAMRVLVCTRNPQEQPANARGTK